MPERAPDPRPLGNRLRDRSLHPEAALIRARAGATLVELAAGGAALVGVRRSEASGAVHLDLELAAAAGVLVADIAQRRGAGNGSGHGDSAAT